jgi:hypothetical protein
MKIQALARLLQLAEDDSGKDSDQRREEDLKRQLEDKKNTLITRKNSGASPESIMRIENDILGIQRNLNRMKLKKEKTA